MPSSLLLILSVADSLLSFDLFASSDEGLGESNAVIKYLRCHSRFAQLLLHMGLQPPLISVPGLLLTEFDPSSKWYRLWQQAP